MLKLPKILCSSRFPCLESKGKVGAAGRPGFSRGEGAAVPGCGEKGKLQGWVWGRLLLSCSQDLSWEIRNSRQGVHPGRSPLFPNLLELEGQHPLSLQRKGWKSNVYPGRAEAAFPNVPQHRVLSVPAVAPCQIPEFLSSRRARRKRAGLPPALTFPQP